MEPWVNSTLESDVTACTHTNMLPEKCALHTHTRVVCPYLRLLDRLSSVSLVTTMWVEPPWLSSCITSICDTQANTYIRTEAVWTTPLYSYIDATGTPVDQTSPYHIREDENGSLPPTCKDGQHISCLYSCRWSSVTGKLAPKCATDYKLLFVPAWLCNNMFCLLMTELKGQEKRVHLAV